MDKELQNNTAISIRVALSIGFVFCLIKILLHISLSGNYGFHGDEYYYIECGEHLAYAYVDHPPMIPWLARLSTELFGISVSGLRFPVAIIAGMTVYLGILFTFLLGGNLFALLLMGFCFMLTPAYLLGASMLDIPVIESFFWILSTIILFQILNSDRKSLWLALGIVAGFAFLTKYTFLLWGIGIAMGFLLTPYRRQILTHWPWFGAGIFLLIVSPNIWWQYTHDWPFLEFMSNIKYSMLEENNTFTMFFEQFLLMNPLNAILGITGLVYIFNSKKNNPAKVIAYMIALTFMVLCWRQGKSYYFAPAYTIILAFGVVAVGHLFQSKKLWMKVVFVALLIFLPIPLAILALPILPLETTDKLFGKVLGNEFTTQAVTSEFHRQYGWPEAVQLVQKAYDSLDEKERSRCSVLARTYAQAGSVNVLGGKMGLPQAYSGHMTHFYWGPPPRDKDIFISYGFKTNYLDIYFEEIELIGMTFHPLGTRGFNDVSVQVCRKPKFPITDIWRSMKYFDH